MTQTTIEAMLKQKIGLDANSIGSNAIAHVIEQRRSRCGVPDLKAYCNLLQSSGEEMKALIEAVVVPETWFFRDREPFRYLSQWIKTEWKSNSILRVLSAPCSTGEEPYSIAMTLLESGLSPAQFQIDALDISQAALEKAKRAIYPKRSFRGGEINPAYFQGVGDQYEVRSQICKTVRFTRENLLESKLLEERQYQIIFCRNLLIYLDQTARSHIMKRLDRALISPGLLFVGSAEASQVMANQYQSVHHPAAFAYRKVELPQAQPVKVPALETVPKPRLIPVSLPKIEQAKALIDRGQLSEAARLCEAHLISDRTDADAYLLLSRIYQDLKRFDSAEQALQRAIYLNPRFYEALIELALLKEQQGDIETATLLRARVQRLLNL